MSQRGISSDKRGAVGWITVLAGAGSSTELARALQQQRHDPEVAVIVISNERGEDVPPAVEASGGPSVMDVLAFVEKPVVARLDADAIGPGHSYLWGCDIVVAREDVVVSDIEADQDASTTGLGGGSMPFAPLYLPPTKLKEYLFLSRVWTAKQLAELNVINYAVPAEQLDATVDEVVGKLLARPAYVLARVKRVTNKRLVRQWNLAQG